MGSVIGVGRAAALGLCLIALVSPQAARAQLSPEIAEINACLCLQQAVATLSSEMNAKNQALDGVNRQLAEFDAQLARERSTINVNNPDAVARYKALLERRDAVYRQSIGPVRADAAQAVARYNTRVNEYNARCANRPFNSALVAAAQAQLMCPPLQ
jgi:multidrug resistance efflux pump